jgi:hypothetical protein
MVASGYTCIRVHSDCYDLASRKGVEKDDKKTCVLVIESHHTPTAFVFCPSQPPVLLFMSTNESDQYLAGSLL